MKSFSSSFSLLLLCLCLCWTPVALATPFTENDIRVLNYALTLEHLEAAFYNYGLSTFSSAEFAALGLTQELLFRTRLASFHENAHVETLQFLISSLSTSTPVRPCQYNFTLVRNLSDFLSLAANLENAGVSAYEGVIDRVNDKDLQQLLATIATVEARHAAYFLSVVGQNPFPRAFDVSSTPQEVVEMISSFLVSCPDDLTLPLPYGATTPPPPSSSAPSNSAAPEMLVKRHLLDELDELQHLSKATQRRKRVTPDLVNPTPSQILENDIAALNYALTLEHLESSFYDFGVHRFTVEDFTNAGYSATFFAYLGMVGAHERAHVQFLTSVINSLKPFAAVPPCSYKFEQFAALKDFLAGALLFEQTGVKAYDGAINRLSNDFLKPAASIASVEARHAAYLASVLGQEPFTTVVDNILTPQQVLQAVTPFLASCPVQLTLPRILLQATAQPADFISCLESKFLQPNNVEGWTASRGAKLSVTAPAFLEGTNVNTLGADWYFVAPLKYRGNQSNKQSLSFLLRTPLLSIFQEFISTAADDLVISSTSFELTLALPALPSTNSTPTSYEFALTPSAGWRIRPTASSDLGDLATADQIAQVLRYVTCIKLRGKYSLNPHSTYFGDFQLCDGTGTGVYVVNCPSVNELECSGRGVCFRGMCTCNTGVFGNSCNTTSRCNTETKFYFQNMGPNSLTYASRTITGRVSSSSMPGVPGVTVSLLVSGSFFPLTSVTTAQDGSFSLTTQFFPEYSYSLKVDSPLYFTTEVSLPSPLASGFSNPLLLTVLPTTIVV